mmetsp:Transcript_58378/g.161474  ORF Transcript_58378/g.161474 Transcript_58378/m.161474 type:complete len:406 (+) Transcript_58378:851-2068(+)
MRPVAPFGELAVLVLDTRRRVLADLELLTEADRWLPAGARLHLDVSTPRPEARGARGGALGPRRPLAPPSVHAIALLARLRVARHDLGLGIWLAQLPTVCGRNLHHPTPALLAATTGVRARRPAVPIAPLTVGLEAIMPLARPQFLQASRTALATDERQGLHRPLARLLALSAGHGAIGPLGPVVELAVLGHLLEACARLTRDGFPECAPFAQATLFIGPLQPALSVGLAAIARLVAIAPLRPRGELTRVWYDVPAALGLHEHLGAWDAASERDLYDRAAPVPLGVPMAASGPPGPLRHLAVVHRALALLAHRRLQQRVVARLATVGGIALDAAHAGVPALSARGAALRPLLPGRQMAGCLLLAGVARPRLLGGARAAMAQRAARAPDTARTVGLVVRAVALAPV